MPIHGLSAAQKEKVKAMMHRARAGAGHLMKGTKGTLVSGGVGAACYYGGKALTEKVDALQKNPYILPAGFLVAGHFLKRKSPDAGIAMMGVAGFVAANTYDSQSSQKQQQQTASPGTPPGGTEFLPKAPGAAQGTMGAGFAMLDLPMLRSGRGAGAVMDAGAVVHPARRRGFDLGVDSDD